MREYALTGVLVDKETVLFMGGLGSLTLNMTPQDYTTFLGELCKAKDIPVVIPGEVTPYKEFAPVAGHVLRINAYLDNGGLNAHLCFYNTEGVEVADVSEEYTETAALPSGAEDADPLTTVIFQLFSNTIIGCGLVPGGTPEDLWQAFISRYN